MTPQQIIGMLVRLFSIWLVVIAFQTLGIAMTLDKQFGHAGALTLFLVPALTLLLAVFLWLFPMTVAHSIVPRTHDANALRIPAREATAAASAIIGIWVLIGALPQLLASGGIAFLGGGSQVLSMYFTQDRIVEFMAVMLQCVIGLFLVTKPWFVAGKVFPVQAGSGTGE
jgi:hypothetical protein